MIMLKMNLKTCFLFSLLFSTGMLVSGQNLVVKDIETTQPVEDVAVYNDSKHKSGLTDKNGMVNLDIFNLNERIYFQHPSFKPVSYLKQEIEQKNFVVFLERETYAIDEFVISAYRWEQNPREIPNKITRVQQKEIVFNNPQTTADLLSHTNEVFIQKSQMGGGSPMIRGFASSSVLLVVDGVRMNNAIYRSGNLHNVISLDPNSIETSEIIFGPGSVTYGSDALGGVMDFHSLKPRLSTSGEMQVSGQLTGRYSSANKE